MRPTCNGVCFFIQKLISLLSSVAKTYTTDPNRREEEEMVTVMIQASADTRHGIIEYAGLLKIDATKEDARTRLARVIFLSRPKSVVARCDLGLSKKHPDFHWASGMLNAYLEEVLEAVETHGEWQMEHEAALGEANSSGGILFKVIYDLEDVRRPRKGKDDPDKELLDALRVLRAIGEPMV